MPIHDVVSEIFVVCVEGFTALVITELQFCTLYLTVSVALHFLISTSEYILHLIDFFALCK